VKPEQQRTNLRLAVSPLTRVEVRDATGTGDGSWTIEGYAAVYEQETTLFDLAGWYRVREEIARGAFADVLQRLAHGDGLVHLNHGHDMKTAMAATDVRGIGQLELSDDFHGMRFFARVDQEDPDAKSLAVKMGRGVVRQSSFAFTIEDEELVESTVMDDGTVDQLWRILKVGDLYDVCVAAQGAYPQTESSLRSLAAASLRVPHLGTPDRSGHGLEGLADRPDLGGRARIAQPAGAEREKAAALTRAQVDAHYQAIARRTR
jgi:HK97 family phage prohead protease